MGHVLRGVRKVSPTGICTQAGRELSAPPPPPAIRIVDLPAVLKAGDLGEIEGGGGIRFLRARINRVPNFKWSPGVPSEEKLPLLTPLPAK